MQPIYILHEHSDGCKYIPGNSVKQYNGKNPQTEKYKEMKDYIRSKLEEENWLTPEKILLLLKKDPSITAESLSLSQITEIVKEWRKETNASKELY